MSTENSRPLSTSNVTDVLDCTSRLRTPHTETADNTRKGHLNMKSIKNSTYHENCCDT